MIGELGAMRRSALVGADLQLHLNSRAYFQQSIDALVRDGNGPGL